MLLKITNFCSAGCRHCMEGSTRAGQHMTEETFRKALAFTVRVERLAYAQGYPPFLLLSGGECTEHPDFEHLVDIALEKRFEVIVITNGLWLADEKRRVEILRRKISWVQVTHDPRYYPHEAPPKVDDDRITYIDQIAQLIPLGRAANRDLPGQLRHGPTSFNVRSTTRSLGSFDAAVSFLRLRGAKALAAGGAGLGSFCAPSIAWDGHVMAGETINCFALGTVESSDVELTRAVMTMQCNRCHLEDNLTPPQRRAIGYLG